MSDNFRIRPILNTEHEFDTPKRILQWALDHKRGFTIAFSLFALALSLCLYYQHDIKAWFEKIGPDVGKWLNDKNNDWIYLILLGILLFVYKKYPKLFAPLTVLAVLGVMIVLCMQHADNQWLVVVLLVAPVLPLVAVMVKTNTRWLHWGAMGIYAAMVALLLIVNPGEFMGKYNPDTTNVYVVGLIGLFSMLCVYLNKHFTRELWPTYITNLGFVLLCLLTAAFSFQYAVRFFLQKPEFSANYLLMAAVITGFIVMFVTVLLMRLPLPKISILMSKLWFHVLYCYLRDFVLRNPPIAFYILLVEIALIVWYILSVKVYNKIQEGDKGKQLFNEPVSLKNATSMTVPFKFNTNYAISFWIYLVPQSKEQNPSSSMFVNILDYGNKPTVTYNAALNTLRVTVRLPAKKTVPPKGEQVQTAQTAYDAAHQAALNAGATEAEAVEAGARTQVEVSLGEEILMADITKIPLQRWHHIVLAYNNGIFDIFLNGVLYRSIPGVMTDMFGTALLVGAPEGNKGKICNVVFYQGGTDPLKSFTENGIAITGEKVIGLYNNFASKNPPVISRVFSIAPDPSYGQMRVNPFEF